MANPIDIIVAQQALKAVDEAIAKVDVLDKKMQETANSFIESSRKMANSVSNITPSTVNNKGADNAKLGSELEALKAKYVSLNDTIVKKAEQSRLAEIKLQQAREKSFDTFDKNSKKEAELLAKNETAYQRIQNSVNLLTKSYQDLAIRKQLGGSLTDKEEKQLISLTDRINLYQKALLTTDSQIGKNTRNVGNYASGYNALGNSINQLTREAPAFANSVQTGFMALSNNWAALEDAVRGAIAQNKILIEQGKPTVSVYKQLAAATFSWTTLISVSVTLLTLYGAKLVDLIRGLGDVEEALKKVDAQQKRNNEGLEQANKNIDHNLILEKNRAKQAGATEEQLAVLDKDAASRKLKNFETTRDIAKKELDLEVNKILQKRGINEKGFSDEVGLTNKLNNQKIALEKSLGKDIVKFTYLARTDKEKAEVESLAKVNKKLSIMEILNSSEIYQKKKENYVKTEEAVYDYGQTVSEINSEVIKGNKDAEKAEEDRLKTIAELRRKELELQLANLDEKLNNEETYYTERLGILDKDFKIRVKIANVDYDEENRLAKGNQEKQKIALINFQIEKLKLMESYNKKRIELEGLELKSVGIDKDKKTKTDVDPFKSVGQSADRVVNKLKGFADESDKLQKKIAQLEQQTKSWLNSFSGEFLQNSGFGSLQTFFDGSFKDLLNGAKTSKEEFAVYFNSIAEVAQDTFNFISNASQQNFDEEKQRLQNQYDIALTYAGDNKAAQEKLAEDLEKQKKEIANRENKAKQKQAIFNIAIDTAQAIIGLWAKPGFPAAIPLAVTVGALGLAQIAMVASQKIPQYWMGGTHDGGLMMVNDGKGSNFQETVVTPDGKVMQPKGRNVVMDAPKGTEIYTHDQWNEKLSEMLQGKGISMSLPQNNYSGISKADMRDAMLEAISEQPQNHTNIDGNGFTNYILRKGNITKSASNRGNSIKTRFS